MERFRLATGREDQARVTRTLVAMTGGLSHLSTEDSPMTWPGHEYLLSWHHWRFERDFNANLYRTGTGVIPQITQSGTVPFGIGFRAKVDTTGARGVATLLWSTDNGASYPFGPVTTAASVDLGNGMLLACAVGTYGADHEWALTIASWLDQTGNGHHWVTIDASDSKYPVPRPTAYGTGVSFDGNAHVLQCTSSFANDLVGGADKPLYMIGVFSVDNTSPTSGQGNIIYVGDAATNRTLLWSFLTAGTTYRVRKQDDAGSAVNVSGGTVDTSIHVAELVHTGTNVTVNVGGTAVLGPSAQDVGTLTPDVATLGKTYFAGAEGNPGAVTWYELACYTSDLDATTRADIRARMRAPYGI